MCDILTHSQLLTALDNKPHILRLKLDEFPFLVHKLPVIPNYVKNNSIEIMITKILTQFELINLEKSCRTS